MVNIYCKADLKIPGWEKLWKELIKSNITRPVGKLLMYYVTWYLPKMYIFIQLTILFIIGYILWENFKHLAIWNKTGKNPHPKLASQVERNIWPSITCLLVIATMRNITKKGNLEAAIGPALNQTLEIKQLDVCDEKSIHNCINSIPQRHIDILSEYSEL